MSLNNLRFVASFVFVIAMGFQAVGAESKKVPRKIANANESESAKFPLDFATFEKLDYLSKFVYTAAMNDVLIERVVALEDNLYDLGTTADGKPTFWAIIHRALIERCEARSGGFRLCAGWARKDEDVKDSGGDDDAPTGECAGLGDLRRHQMKFPNVNLRCPNDGSKAADKSGSKKKRNSKVANVACNPFLFCPIGAASDGKQNSVICVAQDGRETRGCMDKYAELTGSKIQSSVPSKIDGKEPAGVVLQKYYEETKKLTSVERGSRVFAKYSFATKTEDCGALKTACDNLKKHDSFKDVKFDDSVLARGQCYCTAPPEMNSKENMGCHTNYTKAEYDANGKNVREYCGARNKSRTCIDLRKMHGIEIKDGKVSEEEFSFPPQPGNK